MMSVKNVFTKAVLVLALAFGLALAGCVQNQAQPSPSYAPTVVYPTAIQPAATATPTIVAQPSATPSLNERLSSLKDSVSGVLDQVLGKQETFAQDTDPVSGAITYSTGDSTSTFTFQGKVYNAISRQWPPDKTLVQMTSDSGKTKTISYTQTNPTGQAQVSSEVEMECNGFTQMITLSITETNTAVYPFKNLAQQLAKKLIDVCP